MTRRILAAILAVTTVAVVLFGLPLAVGLGREYQRAEIVGLEREAAAASATVGEGALDPRAPDPAELPSPRPPRRLALYRRDGGRAAGDGPLAADDVTRRALAGRVADGVSGGELVVGVPVAQDERVIGALRAAVPLALIVGRVRDAWLAMAGLAAAVLAVAAGAGIVSARRLARPIVGLSRAAGRLGQGDFAVRFTPTGIAEVDRAGAVLTQTAQQLETLIGRERAFSAEASHQLRTRLAGLRLGLESSLLDPDRDREQALETAVEQVDRMHATLDELLALARDIPSDRTHLDVDRLLDDAELAWHGHLAAAGRRMRVACDQPLPTVRASRSAVRQILDVLLSNAAIHGHGTVTLRARDLPGGLALEVCDEGPALLDADAIFSRRSSGSSGHGIGLAMARSLAEAEGGRLRLVDPGPGPRFALVLTAEGHT